MSEENVDYTVLCVHTCWGGDHTAPVSIRRRVQLNDGRLRHEGARCDGTPIALIEGGQGWADLPTGWSNPCPCWECGQHTHLGHCCFDQDTCVEHDELARAWLEGVAHRDEGDRW